MNTYDIECDNLEHGCLQLSCNCTLYELRNAYIKCIEFCHLSIQYAETLNIKLSCGVVFGSNSITFGKQSSKYNVIDAKQYAQKVSQFLDNKIKILPQSFVLKLTNKTIDFKYIHIQFELTDYSIENQQICRVLVKDKIFKSSKYILDEVKIQSNKQPGQRSSSVISFQSDTLQSTQVSYDTENESETSENSQNNIYDDKSNIFKYLASQQQTAVTSEANSAENSCDNNNANAFDDTMFYNQQQLMKKLIELPQMQISLSGTDNIQCTPISNKQKIQQIIDKCKYHLNFLKNQEKYIKFQIPRPVYLLALFTQLINSQIMYETLKVEYRNLTQQKFETNYIGKCVLSLQAIIIFIDLVVYGIMYATEHKIINIKPKQKILTFIIQASIRLSHILQQQYVTSVLVFSLNLEKKLVYLHQDKYILFSKIWNITQVLVTNTQNTLDMTIQHQIKHIYILIYYILQIWSYARIAQQSIIVALCILLYDVVKFIQFLIDLISKSINVELQEKIYNSYLEDLKIPTHQQLQMCTKLQYLKQSKQCIELHQKIQQNSQVEFINIDCNNVYNQESLFALKVQQYFIEKLSKHSVQPILFFNGIIMKIYDTSNEFINYLDKHMTILKVGQNNLYASTDKDIKTTIQIIKDYGILQAKIATGKFKCLMVNDLYVIVDGPAIDILEYLPDEQGIVMSQQIHYDGVGKYVKGGIIVQ
ncbi:Hypothetical_protein [Hexamita inflata]|uniref:Hypothetical_protein n=1 Tax=Hexamita inflata TaxID=28002 RepID=A0AA86U120_9EUKA|nr:Hypothetical protein HINF_LOCUS23819 [Hexamita inflata]